MKICVVGCGTIGLAFGVALASGGAHVVLCDRDDNRLSRIARNEIDCIEPDLRASLAGSLEAGRIALSTAPCTDVDGSSFVICIPTPDAELFELRQLVREIARNSAGADAIFIRSTVPPGTTRSLHAETLRETGRSLLFAAMPDRSVEGSTYADQFRVPHLLGAMNDAAYERGEHMLASIGEIIRLRDPESAEAAKIFSNVWRAGTFALANAFAMIADDHGLDIHDIFEKTSAGYPRFNPPRPGLVGGPCLPKDLRLLIDSSHSDSVELFKGIALSETRFEARAARVASDHITHCAGQKPKVAHIGVTFKGSPPVSDVRGSPALALWRSLSSTHPYAIHVAWDPMHIEQSRVGMTVVNSPYDAASGSSLLIVGHEHPEVLSLDWNRLSASMAPDGLLMDLTGSLRRPDVAGLRRKYWSLGHGPMVHHG